MHQFGSETVEVLLVECEMVSVLIIQERLREYRLPLYEKLATALRHDGVRLRVAYNPPNRTGALKDDIAKATQYNVKHELSS